MGENIFKWSNWWGLISTMYEQLTQLNIKINKNNNKWHNQNWAEDLNRHFSKENTEMANKYMERCSTLLLIRVMQIKTTMRYHFTRPASKNLQTVNTGEDLLEKKGTLFHCWWTCKLIQPLWRTVWRFQKKIKNKTTIDSAIPLLDGYTLRKP